MKVKVYSKATLKKTQPNEVVISIRNPDYFGLDNNSKLDDLIEEQGFISSLVLEFDDVLNPDDGVMFTVTDAQNILNFVKGKTEIAIHCAAGMSRSVAVGSFLRDFFNADVEFTVTGHDNFRNIHVYNTLRRAFYTSQEDNSY